MFVIYTSFSSCICLGEPFITRFGLDFLMQSKTRHFLPVTPFVQGWIMSTSTKPISTSQKNENVIHHQLFVKVDKKNNPQNIRSNHWLSISFNHQNVQSTKWLCFTLHVMNIKYMKMYENFWITKNITFPYFTFLRCTYLFLPILKIFADMNRLQQTFC